MHLTMNQWKETMDQWNNEKGTVEKQTQKAIIGQQIVAKSTTIGNQIEKMNTELLITVY